MNYPMAEMPVAVTRTVQATVNRLIEGYALTVSMTESEITRVLVETTVASFAEAEAVAREHASQNSFPWPKVAVVCR
jgi:hypothetical protein